MATHIDREVPCYSIVSRYGTAITYVSACYVEWVEQLNAKSAILHEQLFLFKERRYRVRPTMKTFVLELSAGVGGQSALTSS